MASQRPSAEEAILNELAALKKRGNALRAAYVALTGKPAELPDPEDSLPVDEPGTRRKVTPPRFVDVPRVTPERAKGPSVVNLALEILDDMPDRDWDYDSLLAEFAHRGRVLANKDPKASLRNAIFMLVQNDEAERVDGGRFRRRRPYSDVDSTVPHPETAAGGSG